MPKPTQNNSYEVGYGKPPRSTQFAPGTSGNRRGRPKGSVRLKSLLEKTLRERVVIKENGRRRTITKIEAALKQLTNKAASGDLAALKSFLWLVQMAEGQTDAGSASTEQMNKVDERAYQAMLKRFGPPDSKEMKR